MLVRKRKQDVCGVVNSDMYQNYILADTHINLLEYENLNYGLYFIKNPVFILSFCLCFRAWHGTAKVCPMSRRVSV